MKPRKTLSVYVLLVGIMSLSIVGGILAFQIFSASVKSQLTAEETAAVKPIDGTISQVVVDNLQQRKVITESELSNLPNTKPSITPTPTVLETAVIATESGVTATTSGSITTQEQPLQ